ncbi:MAG: DUF2298 domain-containing protein [Anaerolineales bacterium]
MKISRARIYDLLLVLVLLVAACFRFVGINWDQNQHLHPDERFLSMVESSISPVGSISDYFNTDTSTLNPNNVGQTFYVYGDLPIFIVRYIAATMTWVSTGAAQYVADHGTAGIGQLFAWMSKTTDWGGYDQVALLGRVLSGLADLGVIFLLYLIAARIYGRKVALLAAAFASVAVLEIQQSHFLTVDNFANFFIFLATYFAVEIGFAKPRIRKQVAEIAEKPEAQALPAEGETADSQVAASSDAEKPKPAAQDDFAVSVLRSALFWNVVGFGVTLGMAVASKINAAPLAILLPVALITRYFQLKQYSVASLPPQEGNQSSAESEDKLNTEHWSLNTGRLFVKLALVLLVIGAVLSVVSFRVFQPYAFKSGDFGKVDLNFSAPDWFDNFKSGQNGLNPLNPKWLANLKEQIDQSSGDPDQPPDLQWANRSKLYSLQNIVEWGLGWPLGILACLGFLYMGWRILTGEGKHFLLWSWTGIYFAWQSMQWNPTMRYQLPIYPLLALMAAWLALLAFERVSQAASENESAVFGIRLSSISRGLSLAMPVVGIIVLLATAIWAFAFIHIYTVDQSRVQATRWIYQNVPGPINLKIGLPDGSTYSQPLPYQSGVIAPSSPYDAQFTPPDSGALQSIVFGHAADTTGAGQQTVTVSLSSEPGGAADKTLATATLTANFAPHADLRGESYTLKFDKPAALEKDTNYFLHFTATNSLVLSGSAPVNESTWDDGLPLRMDGYDGYSGIYQSDHNFEMYWDDNADKLQRFTSNLDTSDYVFISSNRQWATTTRIPERYPLTISLYRNLIGCPAGKDVIWCYTYATPGMFKGALGYDLVKVFESFPTIGPWRINDQPADEAFTVYDHPKVFVFQKRADYNSAKVHALLGAVDLSSVVHLTPLKAASYRSLMLPAAKLKTDEAGGTWSDLFSYGSLLYQNPVIGLLVWYLTIALIGWFTYLFLRLLLPGLSDRGYPLARISGLLLLAYFSWIVGSLGGEYSRLTIAIGCGLIVLTGLAAAWARREEVLAEIRTKGKYFLSVEGVFLAFFLIDLLIRVGNPDLWHASMGGERPMDFTFLNGVLKTTTFPPYDPWFAGGYINYYYWGYVLIGTPIKLLGIAPSLAFNFVLPTLFAMLAIGGFSVAWNLASGMKKQSPDAAEPETLGAENPGPVNSVTENPESANLAAENSGVENPDSEAVAPENPALVSKPWWFAADSLRWLSGLAAGAGLVLIGNLGTVRMIFDGLQRLVVNNDVFNNASASILDHLSWAMQGIPKFLAGQTMQFYPGDWYWIPSRAISTPSGSEITEFPLFTFLYSDLHAHMMAFPLTVLVIAWALSVLMARNMSRWSWLGTLAFGGLVIGALRPTNTWDFPTYLALGSVVAGYAIFRYVDIGDTPRFGIHPVVQRIFLALLGIGLVAGCSLLFFQPFSNWYALGYNSFSLWKEAKSPIGSYFIHWGVFFFVIISWLAWETRQWLAVTPLSALAKLKPYLAYIWLALGVVFLAIFGLLYISKVEIAWFTVPLACWALILIFRPGLPDAKRFVLFMIATGLVITLFVEVIVLDGDIGRMNTIFKFYLQVWIMFAISSAAAIGWMVADMRLWSNGWRNFWYVAGGLLLAGALLFTFTATSAKINDRMAPNVPLTLDSMTYMNFAQYSEKGKDMDLSQDYRAIRWMQANIKGSPVVLESAPAGVQYVWDSRYAIYTGLPTVVGWQWHEEQQRVVMPSGTVAARGQEVLQFYRTTDLNEAKAFLKKYDVRYIVVGQLERASFPEGLAKFEEQDKKLWQAVYRDGDTVIYKVLP